MRKTVISFLFVVVVLLGGVFAFALRPAEATELPPFNADMAIAVVADHPAFVEGLEKEIGWTAAAYNTHNAYGIWHVQFWNAVGDELGWADVSLTLGQVYASETHFGPTDLQRQRAEEVIREFISTQPEVVELLGDPLDYDIYIDYDAWSHFWGVWIDRGGDSLFLAIAFQGENPLEAENPELVTIYFPYVVSYDEWLESTQTQAINIAFSQPEIAAALRDVEGWQATAEVIEDGDGSQWNVYFTVEDQTLAQATVDVIGEEIIDYSVP